MTPEQKLFYLSLYLGADVMIKGWADNHPNRALLIGIVGNEVYVDFTMTKTSWNSYNISKPTTDIKLILKEEPSSYHEDDKANKAYWEEYRSNETLCGKLYTGLRYDKLAGILWLIQNKYDVFNLKSQDLAIYENNLCTK